MTKLSAAILYFLFCITVCHAQYVGGNGKGVSRNTATLNLGNNIFKGGIDDGVSKIAGTLNLGNNIFKGGIDDGVTKVSITSNLGNDIFKGGADDGITHVVATMNLGKNIFYGGADDGFTKVVATPNLGNSFYKGGGGDGWAIVAVSNLQPLPVTLSNFAGAWRQSDALLQWRTSSEFNTNYFELERSYNGIDFSLISTTAAAGNSSAVKDYSYTDRNIQSTVSASVSTLYYRLKTVDRDGKFSYSGIVILKIGKGGSVVVIYPNPAKQFIIISVNKDVLNKKSTIRLASNDGKILVTRKIENLNEQIEIAQYAAGVYYVQISDDNGFTYTQKLIINK